MQRFIGKYVTLQVVIYVDDVNDNSPSFPSQVAQLTFSEGSTPGKLKRESIDKSYPTVPPFEAKSLSSPFLRVPRLFIKTRVQQ
jgi:hypothetical protein